MDRLKYQKKLSWLAGFLSAVGLVFPTLAQAADQPAGGRLEKVRIAYSAISGSQLVGWIANDAGFFRKNGLDLGISSAASCLENVSREGSCSLAANIP